MIFKNIDDFMEWRDLCHDVIKFHQSIMLTSGGFDPLHVGHLRCIQETVKLANDPKKFPSSAKPLVTVLVNCDDFLKAKKGYAFMSLQDRMEIIHAIEGVDCVLPWFYTNDDFTVTKAIHKIRPKWFTKGGDRTDATNIPEWEICQQVGCKVITGVGGKKIRSSSELVENADRFNLEAVALEGWAEGYNEAKDSIETVGQRGSSYHLP